MHLHDQIPIGICHLLKANVPQDASIIDEHINTTKSLYSCVDNFLSILDAVVIGDCFPAGSFDLVDNDICSLLGLLVLF